MRLDSQGGVLLGVWAANLGGSEEMQFLGSHRGSCKGTVEVNRNSRCIKQNQRAQLGTY